MSTGSSIRSWASADDKQFRDKEAVAALFSSATAANKKTRRGPALSAQSDLTQFKTHGINCSASDTPIRSLPLTQRQRQLNATFAVPRADLCEIQEPSSKALVTGRSNSMKQKLTLKERSLQSKLDSIKTIEFNMYKEVFADTLLQITTYREVLEGVKQGYDARIRDLEALNSCYLAQIETLQQQQDRDMHEREVCQRKLKQLAEENYQLSW
jgi:hypothetical protein